MNSVSPFAARVLNRIVWVAILSLVFSSINLAFIGSANAAGLNVNLDQWANKPGQGWQNGDLNGNNSAYAEGRVVPFRFAIEGLEPGTHSFHINYDFTAGGHKAYDFLASYDATESGVTPCSAGGGAVSSLCPVTVPAPAANTVPFLTDPFVGATGKTVTGAETFSGVPRLLTFYGATNVSVTTPLHDPTTSPPTGNTTADIVVTFTTSGSAALFLWGGHLGQSAYWDTANPNGAGQISGAPWHMRTQQLDGSGNKNQDRKRRHGECGRQFLVHDHREQHRRRISDGRVRV